MALLGFPSVLTIHDDYQVRGYSKYSLHYLYRWLFWIYLPIKYARAVVCISPSTKKCIEANGINKFMQVITHHDMTSDFPYSPKKFNLICPEILHIGTAPNKNLETTLRAVSKINCKLCVLKPMNKEQKQIADSLCVDYVNKFDITNKEVYEEYKNADIVLFPSLYEGLGMPILEGQSVGRPIITTNRDPMRWVAGKYGALFLNNPLDDKEIAKYIKQIIEDDSLRLNLINAGRKNIERFTLEYAIKSYLEVYKKAMNK